MRLTSDSAPVNCGRFNRIIRYKLYLINYNLINYNLLIITVLFHPFGPSILGQTRKLDLLQRINDNLFYF